ncbi:50S ribosomal protein L25 [Buchnera aphidicola]|uniref:50S ribosomal protein L25 n=1 Tax=Buchnera aphidicola TaxID=9 RepID=UPI0031B7353B
MIIFEATQRTKIGTQYSRFIRRKENKIPAIIYGFKKYKPTLLIFLKHNNFLNYQITKEFGIKPLCIILKKKKYLVKIQEIQRHAFKLKILHIDFLYISGDFKNF